MKNEKIILVMMVFLLLLKTVLSVETQYGENYKVECSGGSCVTTLYGGQVFYELSNSSWVRVEDAVAVTYVNGILNISFPDRIENVVFDTFINVSGSQYRLSDYMGLINGSNASFIAEKRAGSWHWYANITGLDSVMNSVESFTFKKTRSNSSEIVNGYNKKYGDLYIDFSDLVASRFVVSNFAGQLVVTNVTGRSNIVLDPVVTITGGVANLTGKCGSKVSAGDAHEYPAATVNASQTWYDNVGALDGLIGKFNNNGVNECDGGNNYVTGQLNWTLNGINANEVDSFNFTYMHGPAWDNSMTISFAFRNASANAWTNPVRVICQDCGGSEPYIGSLNLTRTNNASNLFIDNGLNSNFLVTLNSSKGHTHGIQFDYISLTVAWTDNAENTYATESQARNAMEQAINASLTSKNIFNRQQVYARNLSNAQILGRFDKLVASGSKRWAFNYVNTSETHVRMFNLTPSFYVLEMANMSTLDIISDVSNLINATK